MSRLYSNCCHAEVYTIFGDKLLGGGMCPLCKEWCGIEEVEAEESDHAKEAYEPRVGDSVLIELEITKAKYQGGCMCIPVYDKGTMEAFWVASECFENAKLLSRKTRTLTKAEAEALLTEKLGESVRIE